MSSKIAIIVKSAMKFDTEYTSRCTKCNYTFNTRRNMHRHNCSFENIQCNYCPLRLLCLDAINKHCRNKHRNQFIECDLCAGKFRNTVSLGRHRINKHSWKKPILCLLCLYSFETSHRHKIHNCKRIRGDSILSACDLCGLQ